MVRLFFPLTFKLLISPLTSYRRLKYNLLQNLEPLRNLSAVVDTGMQMHVFHNIRAFVWQGMFQEMAVNCLLLGVLVLIPQFWFQLELMIRYGSLVSLAQHKSQQLTKGMTSFLFHSWLHVLYLWCCKPVHCELTGGTVLLKSNLKKIIRTGHHKKEKKTKSWHEDRRFHAHTNKTFLIQVVFCF